MYDPSLHRRTIRRIGAFGRPAVLLASIALVVGASVAATGVRWPVGGPPLLGLLGTAVRDDARPAMERVADAVERLADGEYEVDVPTDRDDEIGHLSETVQKLSLELRERERAVDRRQGFADDLLDAVDDVFYVLDREGSLRRWNESLVDVTGYSDDEIGEMHALEFFDETHRETITDAIEEAFETGEVRVEAPFRTKDGGSIPHEFVASTLDDPDGAEVLVGIGRDISERKGYERELERATDLLEQAQRLAGVSGWELDVRGESHELTATEELYRQVGLDPGDDLDVELLVDSYHPDDRPLIEEKITASLEAGEEYEVVARFQRPDGTQRWMRTIGEAVSEGGEVVALRGSMQDVTDRKERERELERAETIVQAVGDPVYALDADGRFRFVNDAIESVAGYDPDELLGEHVSTVMTEADLETAQELIRTLLDGDDPYRSFEMDLVTADGGVVETENNVALLPLADGEFAGTAGVVRDISERKERERTLERTRDLLQRVQRMARIGGWELDVRADQSEITWTEELYRLHDLPRDAALDLEAILERYHPDDRRRVRRTLERSLATGTGYDLEGRLVTESDGVRWVRAIGEPIREDGEGRSPSGSRTRADDGDIVEYRGAVQDVTERKERELALEALHETALELLNAETVAAVAERIGDAADEILDVDGVALYALDAETNDLDPIAYTPGFVECCGPATSVPVGAGSILWNAFATGTQTVVDDPASIGRSTAFENEIDQAILVPIGDHGVFVAVASETTIDEASRQLVETLAATAEAAFDRLESEASLRERDAELEERNRRLERQIRITEIIRSIDQSLVGADSRAEIERTVCEELVEADGIAFAWIGAADVAGDALEPRTWAGDDGTYLDAVSLEPGSSAEPAVNAANRDEPTVVPNVVDRVKRDPWRKEALGRGFQSVVAVPLAYEDYTYGALSVYADDRDAFADLERTVFAELGASIANAINAVRTRAALHTEAHTELTLRIEGSDEILSRIAREGDCRVEYEGLGTFSGDGALLFVSTSGAEPDAVAAALDGLVAVDDYRLVGRDDDDCRFEVTVAGDVVASRLVRHGATPRSMVADASGTEVVVDVATSTDVREFVETLRDRYGSVELLGRRDVQREAHTRRQLVASLFDELTPRQLEVLRTAYFAGFFEWPRESTGEEIAETLGVSQPTINRHVRLGQRRLLEQLFESEAYVGRAAD